MNIKEQIIWWASSFYEMLDLYRDIYENNCEYNPGKIYKI